MAGPSPILAVPLLYHELRPEPSAYSYVLPTARFAQHLELFAQLAPGAFRPLLTFDDGHCSDLAEASPLLARHNLRGHFFITAGWTGRRAGFLNPAGLRDLRAAGHTLGAHGWSHKLLTQCTPDELHRELHAPKKFLEDLLGEPIDSLSLPGGRGSRHVFQAIEAAGYRTVWTSAPSATRWPVPSASLTRIGRFNIRAGLADAALLDLLTPASGTLARATRTQRLKTLAQTLLGDRLYARLWARLNRSEGDDEPEPAQ